MDEYQDKEETRRGHAPNYWVGFILNLLITGLGHLYIREVGWAVFWFVLAIVLNSVTGLLAAPFVIIGVLIHYRNMYAQKYQGT